MLLLSDASNVTFLLLRAAMHWALLASPVFVVQFVLAASQQCAQIGGCPIIAPLLFSQVVIVFLSHLSSIGMDSSK